MLTFAAQFEEDEYSGLAASAFAWQSVYTGAGVCRGCAHGIGRFVAEVVDSPDRSSADKPFFHHGCQLAVSVIPRRGYSADGFVRTLCGAR